MFFLGFLSVMVTDSISINRDKRTQFREVSPNLLFFPVLYGGCSSTPASTFVLSRSRSTVIFSFLARCHHRAFHTHFRPSMLSSIIN